MQKILSPAFVALAFFAFSLTNAYSIGNHEKRDFTGQATYYEADAGELGACGGVYTSGDLAVALSLSQFDGNCFKTVSITSGGTTVQAQVLDSCPFCGDGNIDMTVALFEKFAPLDTGVIDITWDFV